MAFAFSSCVASFAGRRRRRSALQARSRQRKIVPRLAVLEDRCVPTLTLSPDGIVHDDVKGMNWLANANLAGTINADGSHNDFGVKHINADGSMTWTQALNFVDGMNHYKNSDGSIGYLGHTDWTVPGNFDGAGFNHRGSDMEKLFYGTSEFNGQEGESVTQILASPPLNQLFNHFQPYLYWDRDQVFPGGAAFSFASGYATTVKDIDVSYVIPEYPDKAPKKQPDAPPAPDTMPTGPVPPTNPSLVPIQKGQILHDTALDVYWLADANLAATIYPDGTPKTTWNTFGVPNISPNGLMSYDTAIAWIQAMNEQDYLGHNNWRLPMTTDTSANFYVSGSGIGDAFQGSEMGELYYSELAGKAGHTVLSTDYVAQGFSNFQPYFYWSGKHTEHNANGTGHSTFSFGSGFQGANFHNDELYVIPVFDGTRTVTNKLDDGSVGSLRSVIDAAHGGDTIDLSGLAGTIKLQAPINLVLDGENEQKILDIEGPGAGKLAISGSQTNGIFAFGPYPQLQYRNGTPIPTDLAGLTAMTIVGLTLENGVASEGGAILDDGASLAFTADTFLDDQAIGTSTGGAAAGGAVWISAGEALEPSFSFTSDMFTNCGAVGGWGADGVSDSGGAGGSGNGGAIFFAAGSAVAPSLIVEMSTFNSNYAVGGNGGAGAAGDNFLGNGGDGGSGGNSAGGAIDATFGKSSDGAILLINNELTSNSASGGNGGSGGAGNATTSNGGDYFGGAGGHGGIARGGAVSVNFADSTRGTLELQGDGIEFNTIQGGNGGAGGTGSTAGAGAGGGTAMGGGIDVTVNGHAARTALSLVQSNICGNTAQGGSGGDGGDGLTGGRGGNGTGALGAGLYLNNFGRNSAAIWTLTAIAVDFNSGYSGNGGNGGNGYLSGGNGGNSRDSRGGGIYDAFAGTLDLSQCTIEFNSLNDGAGGGGGSSNGTNGSHGRKSVSAGGGLFIHSNATANASADTVISDNLADKKPNVDGDLGTI